MNININRHLFSMPQQNPVCMNSRLLRGSCFSGSKNKAI